MMLLCDRLCVSASFFFFQAEDGIRDLVRSRGLGDVYKRQPERDDGCDRAQRRNGRSHGPSVLPRGKSDTDQTLSLIHI